MTERYIPTISSEGVSLACDLSALGDAQRKRRFILAQLLQVGTFDVIELADGYAFHVDPTSIIGQHLEELAALERLCCPFLNITVRSAAEDAGLVLEIGGGDAVKEFIAGQFGIRRQTRQSANPARS